MRLHQDWDTPAFRLPPIDEHLGPFPDPPFLKAVTSYRSGPRLEIVESENGLLALEWKERTALMAGHASVTDYHSPRGRAAGDLISQWWRAQKPGTELVWDSLPRRAAEVTEQALTAAGADADTEQTEVAAVLHLPSTFDDYLAMVGKKERHELRRKTRRYARALGEVRLRTWFSATGGFDEFVRLHRLAPGAKGQFMTDRTAALFRELAGLGGWRVDLLEVGDGQASACVFGYSDTDAYYLYNSSFDPSYSSLSPGMVLLASLINRTIEEGLTRFDFLKGGETYKRRLGAAHRPLYTVSCRK